MGNKKAAVSCAAAVEKISQARALIEALSIDASVWSNEGTAEQVSQALEQLQQSMQVVKTQKVYEQIKALLNQYPDYIEKVHVSMNPIHGVVGQVHCKYTAPVLEGLKKVGLDGTGDLRFCRDPKQRVLIQLSETFGVYKTVLELQKMAQNMQKQMATLLDEVGAAKVDTSVSWTVEGVTGAMQQWIGDKAFALLEQKRLDQTTVAPKVVQPKRDDGQNAACDGAVGVKGVQSKKRAARL